MKTLILLLFTLNINTSLVFAESQSSEHNHKGHDHKGHSHEGHDHKMEDKKAEFKEISKDKVVIKVQGMVCAFCAQGIKKNFNAKDEVKETKVDLDKMEVTILFKEGRQLSQKVMKETVTDAGFKFVGVK